MRVERTKQGGEQRHSKFGASQVTRKTENTKRKEVQNECAKASWRELSTGSRCKRMKAVRNICTAKEWWQVLKAKLTGHYRYY